MNEEILQLQERSREKDIILAEATRIDEKGKART
jgi:hypothetical protein